MEAKMNTELTPAEIQAIAEIARRAALADGRVFLMPQAG
jgi:hypothetical protein